MTGETEGVVECLAATEKFPSIDAQQCREKGIFFSLRPALFVRRVDAVEAGGLRGGGGKLLGLRRLALFDRQHGLQNHAGISVLEQCRDARLQCF